MKIVSDRMLRIKGSAEHFRWTCVNRPSCSVDEKLHDNAPHRKCLRKRRLPASACLFSFLSGVALSRTVLRTTRVQYAKHQPYITPNTCVKMTMIVTHLSFSERIAIATLSYCLFIWRPYHQLDYNGLRPG